MAGLLEAHAGGTGLPAHVLSVGTRADGMPATDRARRLLAERGIDVADHRSTPLDGRYIRHADLVVCAEHAHVVSIAGDYPGAFHKSFTLPEIVRLGETTGPRAGTPMDEWLSKVAQGRVDPMRYLELSSQAVGEISDPTGLSPTTWARAFGEIDDLTRRLVGVLS